MCPHQLTKNTWNMSLICCLGLCLPTTSVQHGFCPEKRNVNEVRTIMFALYWTGWQITKNPYRYARQYICLLSFQPWHSSFSSPLYPCSIFQVLNWYGKMHVHFGTKPHFMNTTPYLPWLGNPSLHRLNSQICHRGG